jgi:nitrite reductase/ring-hydroxylating ferredoxin subunit
MDGFQFVARVDEIPQGQAKVVTCNQKAIAVFNVNGTFYAISNLCPHEGGR